MKQIKWVLLTIVVLCLFICSYFAGKVFKQSSIQTEQVSSKKIAKNKDRVSESDKVSCFFI